MNPRQEHYVRFFDRSRLAVTGMGRVAGASLVGYGILMAILLWTLESWLLVWAYIGVMFGLAGWGILRLRLATSATDRALEHLVEIGGTTEVGEDLRRRIARRISTEDRSHVPEALLQFSRTRITGASVQATARAAFGHASSALSLATFLRNGLILAGLFGTVLFFAYHLVSITSSLTDVEALVRGLRGALASTLAGILGSLLLGWWANRIDVQIEDIVRETEGFLSGPLMDALGGVPTEQTAVTEADLWEAMREEVAQMTRETTEAYSKLADDAHSYAVSLQAVTDRLETLPAVQVPPELARLERSIEEFNNSVALLNRTVVPLVETVNEIGNHVPMEFARRLTTLEGEAVKVTAKVETVAGELRSIAGVVSEARAAAQAAQKGAGRSTSAAESARSTAEQVRETAGALSSRIEHFFQDINGGIEAVKIDVDGTRDALGGRMDAMGRSIDAAKQAVEHGSTRLEASNTQLEGHIGRLAREAAALAKVVPELKRLRRLVEWQERVERAPLLRLLLIPFWPKGRLPFMPHRR